AWSCCFYFQAEDGIRDRNVTGVQTCALPIWGLAAGRTAVGGRPDLDRRTGHHAALGGAGGGGDVGQRGAHPCQPGGVDGTGVRRSEERRVGKEKPSTSKRGRALRWHRKCGSE